MTPNPWHGRALIERGIAAARAALAAEAARFDLQAWLDEVDHRERMLRPSTPCYARFDRHARRLTVAVIRAAADHLAVARLEGRLRAARHPTGFGRLDRVWTRAELGVLITEATNRGRQLASGARRPPGPALDPRLIPDDRLAHLIQRHRDLAVVEACRAERERRALRERAA